MSTLDTMRTMHPPLRAATTTTASSSDTSQLRAALREAAITIPQLLRQRAALHGDGLALREKEYGIWNPYSWNHYYETARAVALGLMSLGIKSGDRVAIAGENTPHDSVRLDEMRPVTLGRELRGPCPLLMVENTQQTGRCAAVVGETRSPHVDLAGR